MKAVFESEGSEGEQSDGGTARASHARIALEWLL